MDETLFNSLPLSKKAEYVQENGQFIEAQDFYSFFILVYLLNQQEFKLFYDFTGLLVSVEASNETTGDTFLSSQLEESLDPLDSDN
ncbi:MAG: hypothetical protein WA874_21640 [Chryseosolibacter sp.]